MDTNNVFQLYCYSLITIISSISICQRRFCNDYWPLFRCNSLLRKGGAFILLEVLEETFWVPDGSKPDVRYPRVKVSQEWLLDCLKRNGFAIDVLLLHYYDSNNSPYFDAKGNILVWATKL